MLKTLLIKYLLAFTIIFVGSIFLNWLIVTQLSFKTSTTIIRLSILITACVVALYFLLRPVSTSLTKSKYHGGIIGATVYCLGFSFFIPVFMSQSYFINMGHRVISVNTPEEIDKFPKERFFKIKSFVILPLRYITYQERATIDKFGTIQISKYYLTPIYGDSIEGAAEKPVKIGYGEKFVTSINYKKNEDGTEKELQAIREFEKKSSEDFEKLQLNTIAFFEKIENTDEADNFRQASKFSDDFDKSRDCLILIKRKGTLEDLQVKEKKLFMYSTFICLCAGIFLIFCISYFSKENNQD